MPRFPSDAPLDHVLAAMAKLGFHVVRVGNHVALARQNEDGTQTPMTIPNHRQLKRSTLRTILTQSGISRREFLDAYEDG
ncbi:MAG: type II toxin-antitoxin system HicA family toxin [Fuerstia sp.]|nr:type II toxin-antitoxin system HicA family toxin [Fuerstiella sp.]